MTVRVSNLAEFDEACRAIEVGWKVRWRLNSGEARSRDGEAVSWLERKAYELIGSMLEDDLTELWELRRRRLSRRGSGRAPKPFALGLRVIFVDSPNLLEARKRELIALRLAYAHKHFVPEAFITAFLASIDRRPDPMKIEPHYERWIAFMIRRMDVNMPYEDRGFYPQSILALSQHRSVDTVLRLRTHWS